MKSKISLIVLLSMIFLLVGCVGGKQTVVKTEFVCPDGSVVEHQADCSSKEVEGKAAKGGIVEQVEEVKPPSSEPSGVDSVLAELQASAAKRVTSLQYYLRFETGGESVGDFYKVRKGDGKMKIVLADPLRKPSGDYDSIYLDRATGKAVAKCTEMDSYICTKNKENVIEVFIANYQQKTAFDWMDDMTNGRFLRDSTVQNRKAKMISYQSSNGKQYTVWLDSFYGVPLRIEADDGSETYYFYNIGFNSISEADVTP